ncbi:MAG: aromatic ring-hydroxylating dioxygenase subunit alpha [Gammaproteobacteria bacterium]|nr:aromatic ring-hydroxylating dioxygenase subunit alpha [Gammaproteobacteria bacterium]
MSATPAVASATASRPARALPAWVYEHAGLHRLELERMLLPSWQIACHVNSIPMVGDYVTLDLAGESAIVVRDRGGVIKAFHNVCRHRGARLLDGSGHCRGTITCPYHGWSYRTDGSLLAVPARESFPLLERERHGLKELRTETVFGFVFVAFAGDPPSIARSFAPFAAELAPYRFESMVPLGPITYEEWEVDWKIAMDNYLESYHVPIGHPGLNRMFTPDYEDQSHVPGIARGVSWMRTQESSRWSERMYQRLAPRVVDDLPPTLRNCWRFYSLLPNIGIDVFPEQMDFFQVIPRGPGRCVIRSALFGREDARPQMRTLRYLSNRINKEVNAEDRRLCSRVQRGLRSSSYEPGPLSGIERWMLEFHDLLRERIPEIGLPAAPAHLARA